MSSYDSGGARKFPDLGSEAYFSPEARVWFKKLMAQPEELPPEFWSAIDQRVNTAARISRSQVEGLSQFAAKSAEKILTLETTASTSYTNLATVGPSLTGLSDGTYLVLFGFNGFAPASVGAVMSISVNDAVAADANACSQDNAATASAATALLLTLENANNNSIVAKYRSINAGTSSYSSRWLIALKTGN